ncbi:MAG: ABC-2 family transporter protein [Armatimonadetes bacterium]|nr:ABC-2 family transporter protein [Armatimonadota bacterium]
MRLFWELCKISFQRQLAYRASNLAGLVTNLFFGVLRAAILLALYDNREVIAGLTQRDAVTYTGLTQAMIAYLHLFGVNNGLMNAVYSGEVATDLLKPMNLFPFWLAKEFGGSVVNLLLRGTTIMAAYALVFPITLPDNPLQGVAFAVSLLLAWQVSFAFRFLVNLSAFWVLNAQGIGRLAFTVSWFLCGFLFPLRFFTFVVPAIFLNYAPALYFLGQPDPLGLPAFAPFLAPFVGAGIFLAAMRFWQYGIRHYQSTGS